MLTLPFFVSFVLFVVNSLRPPVLLRNRHPGPCEPKLEVATHLKRQGQDFSSLCLVCYDVTEVNGMKEFSFIIGNCPGSLVEIAEILGNEHVNIEGIAGATVLEEGVICLVTDDPGKARKVLRGAGVDFEENEALVLDLANHPGQLATLLGRLSREKINVLSCYPSVEKSRIIFTVDQAERTKEILRIL